MKKEVTQCLAKYLGGGPDAFRNAHRLCSKGILGVVFAIPELISKRLPLVKSLRAMGPDFRARPDPFLSPRGRWLSARLDSAVEDFSRGLQEESLLNIRMRSSRSMFSDLVRNDRCLVLCLKCLRHRKDRDPAHDVDHFFRVALWTTKLGRGGIIQREAVAAGLLHDLVNLPKNHPEARKASAMSASAASEFLNDIGFGTPEQIQRISQAIEDHSFSGGAVPRSSLGRALQDADRLEALGSVGLIRLFAVGYELGAQPFCCGDVCGKSRELDDKKYSLDHVQKKLMVLKMGIHLSDARREAEARTLRVSRFTGALEEIFSG